MSGDEILPEAARLWLVVAPRRGSDGFRFDFSTISSTRGGAIDKATVVMASRRPTPVWTDLERDGYRVVKARVEIEGEDDEVACDGGAADEPCDFPACKGYGCEPPKASEA